MISTTSSMELSLINGAMSHMKCHTAQVKAGVQWLSTPAVNEVLNLLRARSEKRFQAASASLTSYDSLRK